MRRRRRMRALACTLMLAITSAMFAATPRFFPDDPIWADDDTLLDASGVSMQEDSNAYDFVVHTFARPGDRRDVRAQNVNTLDEVPDSSWFTNRIGRREMSIAELVRGPDRLTGLSLEGWVVAGGKSSGLQPGFRMTDPNGQLHQIEVDPPEHPEMASAAEMIGTAFYHAFGYHTVDVYLAEIDRDRLKISESATIQDPALGHRRPLTQGDLDVVFRRSARQRNGRYRVLVSRFAEGKPAGNFRYYGTRPDDPNDVVNHEHRRELRGARVFGAWLNHDDSRGVNSLDMIESRNGRNYIRHYMFDFGSTLGSGTVFAQRERAGNEYIFEAKPGWKTLASLGLYMRPWMLIDYPEMPAAIGRFEGDAFEPEKWKPEYPNPAFDNMRPDDAFWAARIVSKFSDQAVRAIVEKARYTDPTATEYMTATLLKRRDKVLQTWLNAVNPVVDPVLAANGALTFSNAAITARVADAPDSYTLQWFRFNNASDSRHNVGEASTVTAASAQAPAEFISAAQAGDYVGVTITAKHRTHAAWAKPTTFYFRRTADGWQWVGSERD